MSTCRICGASADGPPILVPEAAKGTGEVFSYVECGSCGTVRITEIPADLERHYPPDYYAFGDRAGADEGRGLRAALLRAWIRRHLTGRGLLGGLLSLRWREPPAFAAWFRITGTGLADPVLDVGCGGGSLLRRLRRLGFRDLTGCDPHLPEEADEPGFRLVRGGPDGTPRRFRLVMLHHALEHAPDPAHLLAAAAERLADGGRLLVRIPVVAEAFRVYREHWCQLDAPRHLHLFTRDGFVALARGVGLRTERQEDDSTEFGVVGSEQVRAGVPLFEPPPFDAERLAAFRARAREWREAGTGDSAMFVLSRGAPRER